MRPSKIIHLVRHGQALHNVRAEPARKAGCSFDDFLQLMREDDAIDACLTEVGLKQAADVHEQAAAAGLAPQLIVVSPLSRAIDTAGIVFGHNKSEDESSIKGENLDAPPYVCLESLRERNGMLLNGQRIEVKALIQKYPYINFDMVVPGRDEQWHAYGGETLETSKDCAKRAYESLCWVVQRPETEVAIVAHGGLFHEMTNGLPKLIHVDERGAERFHNCELRSLRLTWDEPNPTSSSMMGEGGKGGEDEEGGGALVLYLECI